MAYSVSLWFGEGAEAQVRDIWQRLADAGLGTFAGGPVRPHVTLAHGLELDVEAFTAVLRGKLEAQPPFDLTFMGSGIFADSGLLYLTTRMTEALWTLHREVAVLAERQGGGSSLYYRPDFWTPHCTLALNLTPETMIRAVSVCQGTTLISASVNRIGIIENPSERELLTLPLKVR